MMGKKVLSVLRVSLAGSLLLTMPDICISETVDTTTQEKEKLLESIEMQRRELEKQKQAMLEQTQQFHQYQQQMAKQLADQQQRIDELTALVSPQRKRDGSATDSPEKQSPQKTAATPTKEQLANSSQGIQPVGKPPEESEAKRPLDVSSIFDQPGVLTPKGSLNLEPSFMYSYSSSDQLSLVGYTIIPAITIGLIDVRRISRDTFVAGITARYGLTNRLEIEGRIPYVYRYEEASTSPFATDSNVAHSSTDGYGLGDIDMAVRYQLNRQEVGGPSFIASLRVKSDTGTSPFDVEYDPETLLYTESPTGSGFWGIQPGITFIYPSDPAVFFGSLSYTWNVERDIGVVDGVYFGDFDPGDFYGFSFGMGLALNEKASFSLGYDHTIVMKNKIDGNTIDDEVDVQLGILMIGYSYLVRDDLSVVVSLGLGITEAAPDAQITIKVPCNIF
ncbi:transporter [Desulfopila aestuarii]|uniref:Putative MetA-pathway of phenol degradation n=1 Tax=Desulfopila aestuarii DSM 18488 TaxID=1121416 RepID=A0A1M7XXI1_9BACT|nr:transporter [Desulfopila aestuarii]SHO43656.1 Putative MetA-pathway of phenol degradation [Desulfopila aestuarii DSM 18488]